MSEYNDIKEFDDILKAMKANDEGWMDSASESVKFYTGGMGTGQWYDEDLDELQNENRPPLQLNIVLPKVNLVAGLERQQRTYWKARAVDYEDEPTASLITPLLYHIDRGGKLQNVFSRVFKDGVITGRGWVDCYIDVGSDFGAEVFVKRESWANVYVDPDANSMDTSTWQRMARIKWFSLGQLKSMFPDALDDVKEVKDMVRLPELDYEDKSDDTSYETGSRYHQGDIVNPAEYINEKMVKVVEFFTREFVHEYYVINSDTKEMFPMAFKSKKQAEDNIDRVKNVFKQRADDFGAEVSDSFNIIGKSANHIHNTLYSGARVLQKKAKMPYSHNEFPLVPYFYYYEDMGDGIETFGMVENLKDAQREKNKRRSQALDILNRTPKGGGVFDGRMGLRAEDMKRASSSGEWVRVNKINGSLRDMMQQWSMAHLPIVNVVENMEARSEIDAKEISGATDPLMGIASSSKESGFASNVRMRQGMLTLSEALDNLDSTKRKVLNMIVSNLQQYYEESQIRRIIGLESEDVEQDMITKFIGDFKYNKSLKYDIILDKGDQSPTLKAMKFNELAKMIQMLPAYAEALLPAMIENSDWESKDEILEKIQQVAQREQMAKMVEMQQKNQPKQNKQGVNYG